MAGALIFSKWTDEQKKLIRESRITTTRNIVEGIAPHPERKITLFNTSAVGYYAFHGDEELNEDSPHGPRTIGKRGRPFCPLEVFSDPFFAGSAFKEATIVISSILLFLPHFRLRPGK